MLQITSEAIGNVQQASALIDRAVALQPQKREFQAAQGRIKNGRTR